MNAPKLSEPVRAALVLLIDAASNSLAAGSLQVDLDDCMARAAAVLAPKTDAQQGGETPKELTELSRLIAGVLVWNWAEWSKTNNRTEVTVGETEDLFAPHIERLLKPTFAQAASLQSQLQGANDVLIATRQTATTAMNEIRLAAGAPLACDDASDKRAVDYVKAMRSQLADAQKEVGQLREALERIVKIPPHGQGDAVEMECIARNALIQTKRLGLQ